jgi:predicted ester cyclase
MSAEELIRTSVAAINRHDPAAYAAGYTEGAVVIDPFYREPLHGRAAIETDVAALLQALPDARAEVISILADGDRVATEVEVSGTHHGPWVREDGEIAPTGQVTIRTCDVVCITADHLYSANRRYYDVHGVLTQLGLEA